MPALLAVALPGCMAPLAPATFADASPEMRPETFFAGATNSSGVLENSSGSPTRILHVDGSGQTLEDGSFRLVQRSRFDDEPATTRTWVMRRLDDHRYAATLTDAAGPVEGEAYGNLFHVRYAMASPPLGRMEQWLYLQPDGRTVVNEATISVLGVTVARLSERITHEAASK